MLSRGLKVAQMTTLLDNHNNVKYAYAKYVLKQRDWKQTILTELKKLSYSWKLAHYVKHK